MMNTLKMFFAVGMAAGPVSLFAADGPDGSGGSSGAGSPQLLPIVVYGAQVLREKCAPITPDYPGLHELVASMFATMDDAGGVGLAAPQVGLPIRLFVIDCSPWVDDYPELAGYRRVFINAQIYASSEEQVLRDEGCLSFPGIDGTVPRPLAIRMRYQDENFVEHDEEFSGIPAWVIQHEYDHIEGIVFTDRMAPEQLEQQKDKLTELSRMGSCAQNANQ